MRQIALTSFSVALILAGSTKANAGLLLTLDDLGTPGIDVIVRDNQAKDTDPTVGSIAYLSILSGPVGAFNATITLGISKPHLRNSNPLIAELKINEVLLSSTTFPRTLQITLTDTDFNAGA